MDNGKEKYTKTDKRWTVCGIMAAVIVLICGFVFLYQYRIAYDGHTCGGFIPPSVGVVINYDQDNNEKGRKSYSNAAYCSYTSDSVL